MKIEYVGPIVDSAVRVLTDKLGHPPVRGELRACSYVQVTHQVNVVCGISGDVEGQVLFGMSIVTADRISSRMLSRPVITFDQFAASAMCRLIAKVMAGVAAEIAEQGYTCEIHPPLITRGTNVKLRQSEIRAIVIPLAIKDIGAIEMNVALKEIARSAA